MGTSIITKSKNKFNKVAGVDIPVFIHHEGNSSYVLDCVKQAEKFNERVILFGDKSNVHMCHEWYDVSAFTSTLWEEFAKYHSNMSYYSDAYAIQIIKRFFVFDDFMIKNSIEECICLDSDVLVFVNFSELSEIKGYEAAFCIPQNQENMRMAANAGCSYWKQEALHEFLLFCIDIYKNQHYKLEEKWEYHHRNQQPGGVCEMNLLFWWYEQNSEFIWNWIKYNVSGVVDCSFEISENFLENEYYMDKYKSGKRILVRNGLPYFDSIQYGPVRAWAIHFGGGSKMYMHYFRKHLKIAFWIPYIRSVKSIIKHFILDIV